MSEHPPLPEYVQIEPVGQCNLRCQMCPILYRTDGPPYGPPAFMVYETFTKLIDQFTTLKELHLQGLGEPMMHPRFFDMVAYAKAKGVQVTTNTNLMLLNPRRAALCITSGLDCVHVSVDGASAEIYERIRVRAHFDKVAGNIELLVQTRERLGSDHPRLHLVMVVMRQNLHELPDLVRQARRWSIDSMFVQHLSHDFGESSLPPEYKPMRDFVQAQTLLEEDPARIQRFFDEARRVAAELKLDLRLPKTRRKSHPPGTPGRQRCDWPWKGAYISYQGLAMPCCMVATPDRANFGSMAENSVVQIWTAEQYQAFRDRLDSEEPPEICRSCSIYHGTF